LHTKGAVKLIGAKFQYQQRLKYGNIMRIVKNTENRLIHPWYKFAYCYPRTMKDGTVLVYTSVDSDRKATGIIWNTSNKEQAMKVLEERMINKRSTANELSENSK